MAGQFVENPGEYAGRQGSLVVVKDDLLYLRSDGALVVAEAMGGLWRLAMLARALPKGVRDAIYDRVARNRELFFGRTNECMLPSPEIRKMFLERQ